MDTSGTSLVKIQVAVSEGHQIRPLESLPLATWSLRTRTSRVLSDKELLKVVFGSNTIISAYISLIVRILTIMVIVA